MNLREEINKFWAGVILIDSLKNNVLMQKRDSSAPVNPNLWAFFGGSGEVGEIPEDCVVRELKEELGVAIKKDGLVPLRDYFNEKIKTRRYVFVMEFNLGKSEMTLGEGEDFDWIHLDRVLEYQLTDNTRSDLEFFLSKDK